MSQDSIPFVDLFCGAGGLSVGFEQAGFRAAFANDNDPFACATYRSNHANAVVSGQDVEDISASDILRVSNLDRVPLVIGGPNCQGVSLRGKRDPHDPKNLMFRHFRRLIAELAPDWFVMENVPGLLHRHNQALLTEILASFADLGYRCGGEVLLAADYGVPQLRYRFVLLGNRHGAPVVFPDATHKCPLVLNAEPSLFAAQDNRPDWLTVRDGIGDLPPIPNGGGTEEGAYTQDAESAFQQYCRATSERLLNHRCHKTPEHNVLLIQHIPPGKNWKAIPESIRPRRFQHVALKDHTTTYGRLRWDMPARTITTYFNNISSGAFTHPEQHRGISVREGARLQSFPDDYRFQGTLARQYRQVGNAVPPLLARRIAELLAHSLGASAGERVAVHDAAVQYDPKTAYLRIVRPLQGMRFNLDRYLVRS